jgi:Tol biopolymer transport system component
VPYWIRNSPDGHWLRFTLIGQKTGSQSLWEIASDGTNLHPLLPGWHDPPEMCCGAWTFDGKQYVFPTFSQTGGGDICVLPERHWLERPSKPVRLTSGPLDFYGPQPDRGGKTVFVIGVQRRAELMRYDSKLGFVPYLGGLSAGHLAFSADGNWVAYTGVPDGTLWRSRVDGTERLQLTQPPMEVLVPRWSPDGKQIAFCGDTQKTRQSFVISSQGGIPREIAPGTFFSCDPSWSPDGNSLVLTLSAEPISVRSKARLTDYVSTTFGITQSPS